MPSKRNQVLLHEERQLVEKRFFRQEDFETERKLYGRLCGSGLSPGPAGWTGDTLLLPYLPGETLFEAMEAAIAGGSICDIQRLCGQLADWLRRFYRVSGGLILGDSHLKNFLLCESRLFGIDFETCREGDPAEDIALLACSLALCNPVCTPVRVMAARLLLAYCGRVCGCETEALGRAIFSAMRTLCLRRRIPRDQKIKDASILLCRSADTAAVVLAGGESGRMGRDKRLLPLEGKTLLEHALERTAPFLVRQLSVADRSALPEFDRNESGWQLISDQRSKIGPMGGILSCARATEQPYLLLLPCDMPFLSDDLLNALMLSMRAKDDAVLFTEAGKDRTFPMVLRREAVIPLLSDAAGRGRFSILDAIKSGGIALRKIEAISEKSYLPQSFYNINTPRQYKDCRGT
jgi:molybdopterin-guanine dinucleotide biosynthesis protein A